MKKISACPSWLDLSEDRRSFVFVPQKAQIVREIFALSIGGLGSYAIADRLNRKGSSAVWAIADLGSHNYRRDAAQPSHHRRVSAQELVWRK
jgi:hypothetical protein